jgi:hypothetical protein
MIEASTVPSVKQDAISKFMDEIFDSTFNETQNAGVLPNLRWGRIDYFNVTAITTKWAVWRWVSRPNQRNENPLIHTCMAEHRILLC